MICSTCNKTKGDRIKDIVRAVTKHPVRIAKAYYRVVIKNDDIETFAKLRLDQCYNNCDNKILIATIGNKQCWICSTCSCPIETKARDIKEICSLNKW